jgi:flagellar motor protein MotB
MLNKTSITKDVESYRRGVIFGLTMAEVLLLLVFCILLFLAIINDRLKEEVRRLAELTVKFTAEQELNQQLTDTNKKLSKQMTVFASKVATMPETAENSEFTEKMFETAVILEATDPTKASELLYALNENPQLLQQAQLSTINEWMVLTTIAQPAVSAKKPKTEGNNWPPIISLSEAKDWSFNVGSAKLAPKFQDALKGSISDQIYEILNEYDADVIEVIGHTDPQPMSKNSTTNLDNFSVEFFNSNKAIDLSAKDNAGLGYARALSVTKELMKVPKLSGYSILPYSAGQMITPDEQLQTGTSSYDSSQLRRIEIRVRRKQSENYNQ